MSVHIPADVAALVRKRAMDRCEYCRLPQELQAATFHVDHVRPLAAGGPTVLGNLALACVTCSLKKSSRIHACDPRTGRDVSLFNPRPDRWSDHFRWTTQERLIGLTATGRATVDALGLNRPALIRIRKGLRRLGEMS